MTALVATDFTTTLEYKERVGKKHRHRVKLVFGDGALTYPSGGIPLPAFGKLGMKRNIDYLVLAGASSADGYMYKYDKVNHKLRIYVQGYAHGTGGSVTLDDYPVTAAAGVTSGISVSLTTGAGAATGLLGPLVELTTSDAPAATTIYAECVGW